MLDLSRLKPPIMGFRGKNKRKRIRKEQEKDSESKPKPRQNTERKGNWFNNNSSTPTQNKRFDAYYSHQGIFDHSHATATASPSPTPSNETKTANKKIFLDTMATALNASFRISQSIPQVSERSELVFWKKRILAMKCVKC